MRKFKFRLETTLNYRIDQEKASYKIFVQCQIRLQNAQSEKKRLEQQKRAIWEKTSKNLNELTTKELYLRKIEHEINCYEHILNVLQTEYKQAEEKWRIHRMELKAMEKLKENAFKEWMFEQNKIEQSELDEWVTIRRKSA